MSFRTEVNLSKYLEAQYRYIFEQLYMKTPSPRLQTFHRISKPYVTAAAFTFLLISYANAGNPTVQRVQKRIYWPGSQTQNVSLPSRPVSSCHLNLRQLISSAVFRWMRCVWRGWWGVVFISGVYLSVVLGFFIFSLYRLLRVFCIIRS